MKKQLTMITVIAALVSLELVGCNYATSGGIAKKIEANQDIAIGQEDQTDSLGSEEDVAPPDDTDKHGDLHFVIVDAKPHLPVMAPSNKVVPAYQVPTWTAPDSDAADTAPQADDLKVESILWNHPKIKLAFNESFLSSGNEKFSLTGYAYSNNTDYVFIEKLPSIVINEDQVQGTITFGLPKYPTIPALNSNVIIDGQGLAPHYDAIVYVAKISGFVNSDNVAMKKHAEAVITCRALGKICLPCSDEFPECKGVMEHLLHK